MELYLAIALGLTLGELGKKIIWAVEQKIWEFRHRNHDSSYLTKWDELEDEA